MSESPLGEADGSTTTADKDSSVECPTCGKNDFSARQYMKVHHKRVHNESIAGVNTSCDYCGDEFTTDPYRLNEENDNYCSNECQYNAMSNVRGKDHQLYNRIEYNCDNCGESMERKPSRVKNHDMLFCSRKCQTESEDWKEIYRGERTERYEVNCEICGNTFSVLPHRKDTAKYCSRKCRIEKTKTITGNERYNYKENNHHNFGAGFYAMRKKVRENTNFKCEVCGASEDELPRELDVHHIIPRSQFDEVSNANTMQNLAALCQSCHKKWEGIPLQPDRR